MKYLDLILPAYNPSPGWAEYAAARINKLHRLRPHWQIHLWVVTDGSVRGHEPEEREALAQIGELTYVDYPTNRGKGYALRQVVCATRAEYVLYTDWDFPFTDDSYIMALDALEQGADVVLPIRDRANYVRKLSPVRRLLSNGSCLINTLLLRLQSDDTQGGIKAFNSRGRAVFLQTRIDRFLFDTEFIALATQRRLHLVQTLCDVREDIVLSPMSLRTLRREICYIPRLIQARWFS